MPSKQIQPKLDAVIPKTMNPAVRDMLVLQLSPTIPDGLDEEHSVEWLAAIQAAKHYMRIQWDMQFPGQIPWQFS